MAATGLRPVRMLDGTVWAGQVVTCLAPSNYATDLFVGDPVVTTSAGAAQLGITSNYTALGAGASAEDVGTYPIVNLASAASTNRIYGVIVGFEPNRSDLSVTYGKASTVRIVRVAIANANTVFEVYEDGTGALTYVGNTISLASGSGSTTTGYSGWVLSANTGTTSTLQCIAVGISNKYGNAAPGSTSCLWEVVIAQPQVAITQLGAGV